MSLVDIGLGWEQVPQLVEVMGSHRWVVRGAIGVMVCLGGYQMGRHPHRVQIVTRSMKKQIDNAESLKSKYSRQEKYYKWLGGVLGEQVGMVVMMVVVIGGWLLGQEQMTNCYYLLLVSLLLSLLLLYKLVLRWLVSRHRLNAHNNTLFLQQHYQNFGSQLVADLGKPVMRPLKKQLLNNFYLNIQCSQECTQTQSIQNMELDNYKTFIAQLSTFKWCVSCSNHHLDQCRSNCLLNFFSFGCLIGNRYNTTLSQIIHLKQNK